MANLYITRADTWLESDKVPILEEEWLAIVEADPELEIVILDELEKKYKSYELDPPIATIWRGHPDDKKIYFLYDGDCIFCEEAVDYKIFQKMWILAENLGAVLQCEDAVVFDKSGCGISDGRIYVRIIDE